MTEDQIWNCETPAAQLLDIDVLQYIDDALGEVPAPKRGESWGGIAVHYLSTAVELWAHDIMGQLEDMPPQLESEDA